MRSANSADARLASYPRALDSGGAGRVRRRIREGHSARAAPLSGAAHQRVVVRAVHRDADRACGWKSLD